MLQTAQCLPSGAIATLKSKRSCGEIDGPGLASKIPPIHTLAPQPTFEDLQRMSLLRLNSEVHLSFVFSPKDDDRNQRTHFRIGFLLRFGNPEREIRAVSPEPAHNYRDP